MLKMRRHLKLFSFLAVLLFAGALWLATFHHHSNLQGHGDCGACRLVQGIACLVLFVPIVLAATRFQERSFLLRPLLNPLSLFLVNDLKDRGPPLLS